MSITRDELQSLRNRVRVDAVGHDGDIDRHMHALADELDTLDAVMARENITCIYQGGPTTEKPKA